MQLPKIAERDEEEWELRWRRHDGGCRARGGRFRACLMEGTCLGRIPHRKLPDPTCSIGTPTQAIRSRTQTHEIGRLGTRRRRLPPVITASLFRQTHAAPSSSDPPLQSQRPEDSSSSYSPPSGSGRRRARCDRFGAAAAEPPPVEPVRDPSQRRGRAWSSRAWTVKTGSRGVPRTPRCRRRR